MKPLRESDGNGALLEKARELIDAVEPLPESEARMQRVRRALDAPKKGLAVPGLGRVHAFSLAMAAVLFGASAFAAVRYVVTRTEAVRQPAPATRAPTGPALRTEPEEAPAARAAEDATAVEDARAAARPTATEEAVGPDPGAAAPGEGESVAAADGSGASASTRPAPRGKRRPKTKGEATAAAAGVAPPGPEAEDATQEETSAAPAGHDSALVHRAVQALRRDRDPALAARLLAEHARRYPEGPLAEEALSLRVEAAAELGDDRAKQLAREYLRRYPRGRYTDLARHALGEATP